MTTVVRRTFRSSPARDANATWLAIVDMLTRGQSGTPRDELVAVAGIASSVISDRVPHEVPIVVTCEGPRTRIYCLYDEDAIEGSDANEDALGFDALKGDWRVSLPCNTEDLPWVQPALKKVTERITARELDAPVQTEQSEVAAASAAQSLEIDPKGFLDHD